MADLIIILREKLTRLPTGKGIIAQQNLCGQHFFAKNYTFN